ncbi:MAG: nuclear transport factor 2 family protein, partial [Terriglobia bacterium]
AGEGSMKHIPLLVLLATGFLGIARGQEPVSSKPEPAEQIKKEILQVEHQRNQAMLSHDTAVLNRMYVPDLAWTNPSGESLTKAQVLADLRTGRQKFFSIKHDQIQFHIYGNAVLVNGRSRSALEYRGKVSRTVTRRFLNVYVNESGKWRLIAHHQVVVANPKE